MSRLASQMAMYHAYHRHPGTKATHVVGVPPIYWSVMLLASVAPLRWGHAGVVPLSAALLGTLALCAFYVWMDWRIGGVAALLLLAMLALADALAARLTTLQIVGVFLATQALAWTFQLVGHARYEGNKPALLDNVVQALIALIFLVAEMAFALGLRRPLQREVAQAADAFAQAG